MSSAPAPQDPPPTRVDSGLASVVLPLLPGDPREREVVRGLDAAARAAGLPSPKLFGHPGVVAPGRAEALHALGGALAAAIATQHAPTGLGLLAPLVVSAALRVLGREGLGALLPRAPSWTVLLVRPGPRTRRVVCAALDRARPDRTLRILLFALLALGVVAAVYAPPEVERVVAGSLFGFAGLAVWWGRVPGRIGPPEAHAASALLRLAVERAARGEDDVAILVSGNAAARASGVRAALDWFGVNRAAAPVWWVTGAPGPRVGPLRRGPLGPGPVVAVVPGVEALARRGFSVTQLGAVPDRAAVEVDELVSALRSALAAPPADSPGGPPDGLPAAPPDGPPRDARSAG